MMDKLKRFMVSKRGQLSGQVIGLVVLVITLIIGVVVFSKVNTNLGGDLTGSALDAKNNVTKNTYDAFNLTSVAPTIIGAVVILGLIGGLLSRR